MISCRLVVAISTPRNSTSVLSRRGRRLDNEGIPQAGYRMFVFSHAPIDLMSYEGGRLWQLSLICDSQGVAA